MKRLTGLESILHQARRGLDPLSGRLLERPPGFDPRLLPDPTTPIAPWVEQLIVTTVNEAIALNLPLLDALERLTASLEQSGIVLTVDDLQWLLGFNLGIELMQLVVVALVLPPLVLLARDGRYREGRTAAAVLVGVAAVGWVLARLGLTNPVADLADGLGTVALPVVAVLWVAALVVLRSARAVSAGPPRRPASSGSAAATTPATPG